MRIDLSILACLIACNQKQAGSENSELNVQRDSDSIADDTLVEQIAGVWQVVEACHMIRVSMTNGTHYGGLSRSIGFERSNYSRNRIRRVL